MKFRDAKYRMTMAGLLWDFVRCRLTPKGAATQTEPKGLVSAKMKCSRLLCSLVGLTSFLLYAPETRSQEWQESVTTFGVEAIERMEITGDSQETAGETAASLLANEAIAPYFEIAKPEQGQYNNDALEFTQKEDWPEPVNDSKIYSLLLVERLEYRGHDGEDLLNWEILSWVGGDYERLWIKSEGDIGSDHGDGEAEVQLLYGKLISSFWDFQAGLRYDRLYGSEQDSGRAFGVIGLQGLAPYLFEVDAAMFVSEDGDLSARFVSESQLLLSQRLILQPELETNLALQKVEEFGVGAGINDIELGVRLRYEFSRQFAPYLGVNWSRKFGETADLAREEGESVDDFSVLGGMRLLF